MSWLSRTFPFNAEQTVNILGEFGPLITLFVVNALAGVNAGTWALLISTVVAMAATWWILKRLPVMPLIAGGVSITFGVLTLVTGDPRWIQIKVTVFNFLFAVFLMVGVRNGWNFFHFVFQKTFHYSDEGWRRFTVNFAFFFLLTAAANEAVRQAFDLETWILFKMFVVMPLAGLFAWWQSRLMQRYELRRESAGRPAPSALRVG